MNPWQEWKKRNLEAQRAGRVTPTALLNPDTPEVDEETYQKRMSICEACPNYKVTKQCSKCGCFMPAKAKMEFATCPESRW